jgi:hypothetical protein
VVPQCPKPVQESMVTKGLPEPAPSTDHPAVEARVNLVGGGPQHSAGWPHAGRVRVRHVDIAPQYGVVGTPKLLTVPAQYLIFVRRTSSSVKLVAM